MYKEIYSYKWTRTNLVDYYLGCVSYIMGKNIK